MSGRGDEQAARAILRALEKGPLDVLDLLAALRARLPDLLALHEGAVHAVLLRIVRTGGVLADGFSERGLMLYRLLDTPPPAEAVEPPPLGPVDSEAIAKAALRAASGVRDPASRGRVQADVIAHLESLGAETAKFGSVRGLRNLLHRVSRGKPAVCLTAGGGDAVRRAVLHEGPWIAGAALVWILLKVFIVQTYVIPSESMVPTLLMQDRVVVFLFSKGEVPERWSVATFEGKDKTLVKRLVGLPGERISILHGDVYLGPVEDLRLLVKPDDVREALRTRLGDWDLRAPKPPPGWTVSTSRADASRLWRSALFEAHPRRIGAERGGGFAMRDGYVRLEVGDLAEGPVRLTLTRGPAERSDAGAEQGTLQWSLGLGSEGVRLEEQRVGEGAGVAQVLAEAAPPTGRGASLRISYVDGILRASGGGLRYQAPRKAPDGPLTVTIEAPATSTGDLRLVLDRDVHYAHLGSHGVPFQDVARRRGPNPHLIPPGSLYFLGDNTTDSHDSRFSSLGDVPAGSVVGPVSFRIWPPSRWGRVR